MPLLWWCIIHRETGSCSYYIIQSIPIFPSLIKLSWQKQICHIGVIQIVPPTGNRKLVLYDKHQMIYMKLSCFCQQMCIRTQLVTSVCSLVQPLPSLTGLQGPIQCFNCFQGCQAVHPILAKAISQEPLVGIFLK